MYCSPQHAGLGRRDPNKRVVKVCARPGCKAEFESFTSMNAVFCSRECWAKQAPDQIIVRDPQYGDVKLQSGYESYIWGFCKVHKIPITRVDRSEAVPVGDGWYAPDFVINGRYVEVKGFEDEDDRRRYAAWEKVHGALLVLREEDLKALTVETFNPVVTNPSPVN